MSTTATLGQGAHILTLLGQKDVSKEHLTALVESGLLADLLDTNPAKVDREEFRKFLGLDPLEMWIVVNYGMTLEQMVAASRYDWVNDNITLNRFPITGSGENRLKSDIIHFNYSISSENAVKVMGKMKKRPGTIEELLAFGATFPNTQRKFPIVALGSSCEIHGGRRVAVLCERDSKRHLDLYRWDGDWDDRYRFLAFDQLSGS